MALTYRKRRKYFHCSMSIFDLMSNTIQKTYLSHHFWFYSLIISVNISKSFPKCETERKGYERSLHTDYLKNFFNLYILGKIHNNGNIHWVWSFFCKSWSIFPECPPHTHLAIHPPRCEPPLTPGNPRTSQRCILVCTAEIFSWCALNRDIGTFLVFVQEQWVGPIRYSLTTPETPAAWSRIYLQNCTFWVALELYSCCPHHVDCDQDGKLLMPKVNHLETL